MKKEIVQQPKEEKVHAVFESIYDKYDYMNSVISFSLHKRWRKDVMKQMQVRPGSIALDICCGTGDWTLQLAEAVGKEGKVIGLDFSRNMLSIGEEKLKKTASTNVTFVEGNALALPFPDESFDYVTIGFGLRNVASYETALREMHRVLKKDGLAVCLETSQPENKNIRSLYSLYFTKMMPALGKYVVNSYNEYSWLQESTMAFPNKNTLTSLFIKSGFQRVQVTPYSMGTVAAHFAQKASRMSEGVQ